MHLSHYSGAKNHKECLLCTSAVTDTLSFKNVKIATLSDFPRKLKKRNSCGVPRPSGAPCFALLGKLPGKFKEKQSELRGVTRA